MRLRGVDLPGQGIRGRSYVSALRLRQRSGAAVIPDWDAKLLRLVGEVRRDARAGEYDHTDREDLEDSVVALERRGPGVPVPVGLEDDLRHVAVISPAGGDALRALGPKRSGGRRAAAILFRDAKRGNRGPRESDTCCEIPAAENSRRTPLWAPTACRPIALWKARGRGPSGKAGSARTNAIDRSENELGVIRTRARPSSSGTGAHLPRQAGGARPREDDRRQGGGGLH